MIIEKDLKLGTLHGTPFIEGKVITDQFREVHDEIVAAREDLFPGSTTTENFNYTSNDYSSYHIDVMTRFPKLQYVIPVIVEMLEMVGEDPKDFYLKSWMNIWAKGQRISPHTHYGEWHGYWVLNDTQTETYYAKPDAGVGDRNIYPVQNFDGRIVFAPTNLPHWGKKNTQEELRISMAYNLSTWDEVLREESDLANDTVTKFSEAVLPLKDYL